MASKSLYEILQVHPAASPEVVKAAYKTLTAKYHPDRDSSKDAARTFAEIQRAFEVLSDPVRRRQYDLNPDAGRTPVTEPVPVLRVDGSSTFLTLAEHQRRGWQESAGCDLSNQDFSGVSFKNAKLAGARLDGSRFSGCDFRGADLTDCSAERCQFDKVDFAGAKLVNSDISNCSIRDAKFFGIGKRWESLNVDSNERFSAHDYNKTDLSNSAELECVTVLENVNFCRSDLSGSAFSRPNHEKSEAKETSTSWGTSKSTVVWTKQMFRSAVVKHCDFSEAALLRCGCEGLSLAGSKFESTDLQQADMRSCDVAGIDLSTANLLDTNLTECRYTEGTKFPDGFGVPGGAVNTDELHRKQAAFRETAERDSNRLMLVASLTVLAIIAGIVLLVYILTPAPPKFYARPASGVQTDRTDGRISAWVLPEDTSGGNSAERSVIVELLSHSRNIDLPSHDLSIEITPRSRAQKFSTSYFLESGFAKSIRFVVVGNQGHNNGLFSFPSGIKEVELDVPVRAYNGRSQIRFFWPKESEQEHQISLVDFYLASKELNTNGRVYVALP